MYDIEYPGAVEHEAVDGVGALGAIAVVVVDVELMLEALEREAAVGDSAGPRRHRERTPGHGMAHVGDIDEERLAGDGDLPDPAAGVGMHRQGDVVGGERQDHRVILHGCERSCNV